MTNPEAADVLREYIRTNKPQSLGLQRALEKAITALEHQPEPQTQELGPFSTVASVLLGGTQPIALQCWNCDAIIDDIDHAVCPMCGSSNLRPVSEIGRKA